jgi:hypothetical protein
LGELKELKRAVESLSSGRELYKRVKSFCGHWERATSLNEHWESLVRRNGTGRALGELKELA